MRCSSSSPDTNYGGLILYSSTDALSQVSSFVHALRLSILKFSYNKALDEAFHSS